jgi:hypothetical protein
MKLISPMQRYWSRVTPKDSEGNVLYDSDNRYQEYKESDLNTALFPCGGAKAGRVHFDADAGSKAFVMWRTIHPDLAGNCTIRLGDGLTDTADEFETLTPLDNSANADGKFPCGRSTT